MKRLSVIAALTIALCGSYFFYVSDAANAETEDAAAEPGYQKPAESVLRQQLTPLQYAVTQKDDTEPPFKNAYWDEERDGIYVDIVSGEPLFSSQHKFKSGTGWPSFSQPIKSDTIVEHDDYRLFFKRTEVRSRKADSHLGHVFDDGPAPTGLRYCINSASMRFIPKEKLVEEGYGEFLAMFESGKQK